MDKKINVVFVCTLNTQRSALCQFILDKYAHDRFNVSSAGLINTKNSPMGESVKTVLHECEKIKMSKLNEFRSTYFTKEIGDNADVIVCVTREHASNICEEYPEFANKVIYFKRSLTYSCSTDDGAYLCMMIVKENLKDLFDVKFQNIVIEKLTKKDIPKIQMIENMNFSHPYDMNKVLGDDKISLGAFVDGNLCGYVCSYYVLDEDNILTIAVGENYRRIGVGQALISALIDECKSREIKNIYLEVRYSNTSAILLYEKMGFVKCGLRKDYYIDPKEDGILYNYEIR